jgi:hypothetical protein
VPAESSRVSLMSLVREISFYPIVMLISAGDDGQGWLNIATVFGYFEKKRLANNYGGEV